jgi:hypothetical protein
MAVPTIDRPSEPEDVTAAIDLSEDQARGPQLSLRRQAAERVLADSGAWVRCRSCGMDVRAAQLARHRDTQH